MAAKKVDIMEIRQLLFVKEKGESNPSYEKFLSIYRNTINHYVRLFKASGLTYVELLSQDETSLEEMFPAPAELHSVDKQEPCVRIANPDQQGKIAVNKIYLSIIVLN
jgi:methylase of polypeptide subunit release factors